MKSFQNEINLINLRHFRVIVFISMEVEEMPHSDNIDLSPILKQSHPYLHHPKKTIKTQNQIELPQIYQIKPTHSRTVSLHTNRHLRYLFHEFCRQSYIGGVNATFDQIANSAQKMTINKWMVFCRQFDLTAKLSSKQVKQIFKDATNEASQMDISAFCSALSKIQIQANIEDKQLIKNYLHVDSRDSARNRIVNMKVSFGGPQKNYFIEAAIPQHIRQQIKIRQRIKSQRKQKDVILHQGKFRQHILREVSERKQAREQRSRNLLKHQSITSPPPVPHKNPLYQNLSHKVNTRINKSTSNQTNSSFSSYSQIFKSKKASTAQSQIFELSAPKYSENVQSKSRLKFEKQRECQNQQLHFDVKEEEAEDEVVEEQPQNSKHEENVDVDWMIDSEESDQILRDHFEKEKKIKDQLKKYTQSVKLHQKQNIGQLQKGISNNEFEEGLQEESSDFLITRYT